MPRVGVCLAGSGHRDGSEIHESTLTLLALDQAGAQIVCFGPTEDQPHVIDHCTGNVVEGQSRNMLVEAARIARGDIKDIANVHAAELDAVVFPGGLGAAKCLSTFASDGAQCSVLPEVSRLIGEMIDAGRPIGAICIAPAMLTRVLGQRSIKARVTIGNDPKVAAAIGEMGGDHHECPVDSCIVDREHKVVTTPAYMLANGPAEVYSGVRQLVTELLQLVA
jgi:enhancing lycopene biosynthesis protein 2